jgi:hypothetical protein
MHHACGDNFEASIFEARKDLANKIAGNRIGFDDREGPFNSHLNSEKSLRIQR